MIPNPYDHDEFHGRLGDNATIAMLKQVEIDLGYELTITQFIGGAAASAGSHTVGRMVDLAAYDWQNKLRAVARRGGFGWYRPFVPGLWPAHIHIGSIFVDRTNQKGISGLGFRQIASWDAVRDGLKSNSKDFFTERPNPKRAWTLEDYRASFAEPPLKPTHVQLLRNELVSAIQDLAAGLVHLSEVQDGRVRVHKQAEPIVEERNRLKQILAELPPR